MGNASRTSGLAGDAPRGAGLLHALVRRPWILIGAVAVVLLVSWVASTRREPHHLRVGFDTAVSLVPGLDVQVDGIDAGKVSKVDYRDGHAVVEIGVADAYWPLHAGTTATIRYGTTVGNGTRRVELAPGPTSAPVLPDGGVIPAKDAVPPVEIDQVFNTLDRRTRAHMQSLVDGTAASFDGHEQAFGAGLAASAKGLRAIAALAGDLDRDPGALDALVVNGERATAALASRRAAISRLVGSASATFDEFAARSAAMQRSLSELPPTLDATTETLGRLDASVGRLQPLFADLAPGAAALRPLAPVARRAIARLRRVAPDGAATLASLHAAAPDVHGLLAEATPVASELAPTLGNLAPMLACLRPYAPETAAALSNWASYTKNYDGISHYARVKVTASPYSLNSTPDVTTKQYMEALPMLSYALPRPPGLNAGTPWFLPECGAGPDSLDPSKDPEDTARPGGPAPTRKATR